MKKKMSVFLMFLSLIAGRASADDLIMEKFVSSGYTTLNHAFQLTCKIYHQKVVLTESRHGSYRVWENNISIPLEVYQNIETANSAPINTEKYSACDVGTTMYTAYHHFDENTVSRVVVDHNPDCGPRLINDSEVTERLKAYMNDVCQPK